MDHDQNRRIYRAARDAGWWLEGPWTGWSRQRSGALAGPPAEDYEAVFERASRNLRDWLRQWAREQSRAAGQMERLERLPASRQVFFLLNLDLAHGFCLAGMLLESALHQVFLDPEQAHHRARLANLVTGRLSLEHYGPDLVAEISCRAWAVWGHMRRILGRLGRATEAFHQARRLLSQSSGEPMEEGLLLDFESSLWATQGRFVEATEGLEKARECFELVSDQHLAGRAEVKQGVVALLAGRHTRGAGLLGAGLPRLQPRRDPYLATLGEALLAALRLESRRLDDRMEAHRRLHRARSYLVLPRAVPVRPLVERVARHFDARQQGPVLSTWPRRL